MKVLIISGSVAKLPDPVYPLGAAIVGTSVRRAGHTVSWFDALHHKTPIEELELTLRATPPDVILMSIRNIDSAAFPSPERHFEDHLPIVQCCRDHSNAPIVLGGSGFSLMPEEFIAFLNADVGIQGDGEGVILEVLSALESGRAVGPVVKAEPLSTPFLAPDRDLFDADWYYRHGGVANVQTKRGCPLNCIYCTYPCLEGNALRRSDPELVVDELESLKRSGIEHFFFVDTSFNASESHAMAICEAIIKKSLDISFAAYLIPRSRSSEFPLLLKRAGCTAAELGTDALTDEMLLAYNKGFDVGDVLSFSSALKSLDIPQCHNLIFGGPGETRATMERSIEQMDGVDPTAVILTIGLRIFPDTELARISFEKTSALSGRQLEPVFFVDEQVSDVIVDKCAEWSESRRGWICPGLGKRYNPRYLERLRLHRNRKGPLWPMF